METTREILQRLCVPELRAPVEGESEAAALERQVLGAGRHFRTEEGRAEWATLPESFQVWYNAAASALRAKTPIPSPDGAAVEEPPKPAADPPADGSNPGDDPVAKKKTTKKKTTKKPAAKAAKPAAAKKPAAKPKAAKPAAAKKPATKPAKPAGEKRARKPKAEKGTDGRRSRFDPNKGINLVMRAVVRNPRITVAEMMDLRAKEFPEVSEVSTRTQRNIMLSALRILKVEGGLKPELAAKVNADA